MFIAYKPEFSFYGTIHWEMHGGEAAAHGLSATYIERAPTSLDNGWIYASVGDTYSGLKPIAIGIDQAAGRLVGLKFWFACFYCEDETGHHYRYGLTAYDDRQPDNPFQFYTLDVSRNGYLAVYKASQSDSVSGNGPLWQLVGFDPSEVNSDDIIPRVTLISPAGKPVRRKMEDYFPYLNDGAGHDAYFTIKIAEDGKRQPW
jgi:hypothetical protein